MRRAFRLGLGDGHIAGEVDDELAFHVEMRTHKLIAAGMPADAARHEALRQFGNLHQVHQSCVTLDEQRERTMKRIRWADELHQDAGFAVRALRRNPAFAMVAVLTLALGIGANTAIFTLIDAVMLRPIPVAAPHQLVAIGDPAEIGSMTNGPPATFLFSYPLYQDLRHNNHLVSGLLASGRTGRLDVRIETGGGGLEHPSGSFVSGNYFTVLGIPASQGRMFGPPEDAAAGASPVAVISDNYWTTRFGRDPHIIGRDLVVDDARLTIVGVAAAGFSGETVGRQTDLWLPLTMQPVLKPHEPLLETRNSSWLLLLGRLAPGVTLAQAESGFPPLVRELVIARLEAPSTPDQYHDAVVPVGSGAQGFSRVRRTYGAPLFTMMAGVGLLLFIICANVANLLLARAVARTAEFSVRLAIGARRGRLLRQLLTESAVLALVSGIVGTGMAWAGSKFLLSIVAGSGGAALPLNVGPDLRMLSFTFGLSLLAVALFGLFPAVRASGLDLALNLRTRGVSGGLGARGQRFPIGQLMIAGQIALSLVLLLGAGLLVRSLQHLERAEVGLDRDHLLMLSVDTRIRGYSGEPLSELARSLQERFEHMPGIVAATYSENGMFGGTESNSLVGVPGFGGRTFNDSLSKSDQVGAHYVAGIGGRLISGRDFTAQDAASHGQHVALVNQAFVRWYFGNVNPLGRSFRLGDTVMDIVGVIGDVRDHALDAPPPRRFYLPLPEYLAGTPSALNFEIRTRGAPQDLIAAVRTAVSAQDGSLPIVTLQPLSLSMRQSIVEERLLAQVASGFGILALVLCAIGLYGVMSYAVTRRTGEIGLRIALGAEPAAMILMVVGDAVRLLAIGVVVGIPLAFAATRLLRSQLHGVGPADLGAAGTALAVLTLATLLAAFIPARRAARVSPLSAIGQQ
jgi:predicted permease